MILIGVINVVLGFCSYSRPSEVHERIVPDVPNARAGSATAARAATGCAPAITARIQVDMPGAVITACTADRVTVLRGERQVELAMAGNDVVEVAESLSLPEIPAAVMRAFAIAYPRTIPAGAVKRTKRGVDPVYELSFPPNTAHKVATLRGDGTVIDLR